MGIGSLMVIGYMGNRVLGAVFPSAVMAASRCVGFALPLQTGGAGWRRKVELQVRRGYNGDLKLGLGQHDCVCQAGAKYDSGYKKSDSKRTASKKSEKYASVAEASGGRGARKASRGPKNEVRHWLKDGGVRSCR